MKAPWRFASYLRLAQRLIDESRLPGLVLRAARKAALQGRGFAGLKEDLRLLQNLCLAWWRGEYRAIGSQALLAVVAALLYFVTPLDALPDWLPALGLVDDLAVLAWVLRTWRGELEAFRTWRAAQAPQALARIERLPTSTDERPDGQQP